MRTMTAKEWRAKTDEERQAWYRQEAWDEYDDDELTVEEAPLEEVVDMSDQETGNGAWVRSWVYVRQPTCSGCGAQMFECYCEEEAEATAA